MRALKPASALLLTTALFLATPATAGGPVDSTSQTALRAPTGGLSLVPERWRYRPAPPAPIVDTAATSDRGNAGVDAESLRSLEVVYVADRNSLVNTVRARRGLPLLTLWEGAGRCLFFGITDRGRAGLSLVRMRQLERTGTTDNGTTALYAELTGQRRATFPAPPALIEHRVR